MDSSSAEVGPAALTDSNDAALRLLAATAETPESAPLLAVAHALLSLSPCRARHVSQPQPAPGNGLQPHLSWGDES